MCICISKSTDLHNSVLWILVIHYLRPVHSVIIQLQKSTRFSIFVQDRQLSRHPWKIGIVFFSELQLVLHLVCCEDAKTRNKKKQKTQQTHCVADYCYRFLWSVRPLTSKIQNTKPEFQRLQKSLKIMVFDLGRRHRIFQIFYLLHR